MYIFSSKRFAYIIQNVLSKKAFNFKIESVFEDLIEKKESYERHYELQNMLKVEGRRKIEMRFYYMNEQYTRSSLFYREFHNAG